MGLRAIFQEQVEKTIGKPDHKSAGREGATVFLRRFGNRFVRVVAIVQDGSTTVITLHWVQQRRIKENTV